MSPRVATVLGLLAGVASAGLVVALVVALAPEVALVPPQSPGAPPSGIPSLEIATQAPSPSGSSAAATAPASRLLPPASPGTETGAFHVGRPAPPLSVPQLGGGRVELAALRGHPVWIEFMATWCPSCRDEFPLMNGFAARFAEEGLVVVAIDVREDEGTVAAFANQLGPAFPIGLDGDGSAGTAWDVVALPMHFFIDADGIVRDGAVGGIGPDVMASALETIMPGVSVGP